MALLRLLPLVLPLVLRLLRAGLWLLPCAGCARSLPDRCGFKAELHTWEGRWRLSLHAQPMGLGGRGRAGPHVHTAGAHTRDHECDHARETGKHAWQVPLAMPIPIPVTMSVTSGHSLTMPGTVM